MRGLNRHALFALFALFVGSALGSGALAAQQDPAPKRIRVIRNGDSTYMKVMVNTDEVERMIQELIASRAMEQTIAQSMRDVAGAQVDPKKMRELSDQLGRIAQKNSQLMTTIEMSCAGDRQPQGYIGVQFDLLQTFSGDEVPPMASGQLRDYPKIDMVYPESPASKAGMHRGDVVLSLGGQDTRKPVQLDKILKPGTKLSVRVQRDGATKEFVLTIEKRPSDYNSNCANIDSVIGPEFDAPVIYMRSTPARGGSGPFAGALPRMRAPNAPDAPLGVLAPAVPGVPGLPMPAMAPMAGGFAFAFSGGSSMIFGAALQTLDDDWRSALGVDNGILVTKVLDGSPAKDSGLHSGDVIVSVDGETISSLRALTRIVGNSESKSVKLGIIRGSKPQAVVLRWGQK